jgi:phospholipase/lecithinase/hemolysin
MEFMKINVYCFVICCFARSIAAVDDGHKQPYHPPALFVFGDSLADAGNNNFIPKCAARANFPPYGMSFFRHPTGRFTNGRTAIDFIATYMGLPFPSPFLDPQGNFSAGINFASGGSGLLDSTDQNLNIISFSHQIWQFTHFASTLVKKNGGIAVESYLSKSLYCISVGGNDISSYIQNATYQNTTTPRELVTLLLNKYDQYLSRLYRSGARKFLLFDISTVGCTPSSRLFGYISTANGECLDIANKLAKEYNAGLKQLLTRAMQKLQGAIILQPYSYNFTLSVIENGQAYGFGETRSACCGAGAFNTQVKCGKWKAKEKAVGAENYKQFICKDPNAYLFWDGTHPTERLNAIFAHQLWTGNSSVISPFNLSSLVLGNGIHTPP